MKKYLRPFLFVAAGTLAGLAYYYLFGCSGNCTITSNPWMTMVYMGVVGLLLGEVTKKKETA